MDFLTTFLTSEAVQTAFLAILSPVLLFVLNRIASAMNASAGIRIAEKDLNTFHSSIISGVESALKFGLPEGTATFKAHVKAHMLQSSPDTFAKMSPLPDVLDNLIYRFTRQSIAKFGEPK